MERGEVQRHFRSQVFQHPFGELAEFARVVVESRDDQVGDFKPNVGLLLQPLQHIQYWLQVSQRNAPVKVFRKCLQVHVGGVDVVVDFVEGVVGDVAIRNHHGVQSVLFGRLADVDRSEEHTSELQSRLHLVCRLLLEKKKNKDQDNSL